MKLEKYQEADETLYSRLVFNRETMNMNYGRIFTEEESKLLFQVMLSHMKTRILSSEWEH